MIKLGEEIYAIENADDLFSAAVNNMFITTVSVDKVTNELEIIKTPKEVGKIAKMYMDEDADYGWLAFGNYDNGDSREQDIVYIRDSVFIQNSPYHMMIEMAQNNDVYTVFLDDSASQWNVVIADTKEFDISDLADMLVRKECIIVTVGPKEEEPEEEKSITIQPGKEDFATMFDSIFDKFCTDLAELRTKTSNTIQSNSRINLTH